MVLMKCFKTCNFHFVLSRPVKKRWQRLRQPPNSCWTPAAVILLSCDFELAWCIILAKDLGIHSTTSLQAKLWRLCFRLQWRNQEAEYRLQPRPRHRPHRCSLCPAVWLPKSKIYQVEGEKSLFVYQTPPSNRISYSGSWNGSQNLEIIILMNNPRLRKVLTRSWRRQKRGRKALKQKGWSPHPAKKFILSNIGFRIKNLLSQLAKIDIAQQKKEESEKAKVWNHHQLVLRDASYLKSPIFSIHLFFSQCIQG